MTCCISGTPRPYGAGQPRPIQRCSPSSFSHGRRVSKPSCSRPGPPAPLSSAKSPARCSASQSRTSARNASSSAEKRKSTRRSLPCMEIRPDTVTASGLKFGVLACGEAGPLALCLHGFPDCAQTFRHLLPSLADAGFRAVAPWLRGYEPTGIPATGDYSINALAADANALHDALGGDGEAVLIGHDWGAMTS